MFLLISMPDANANSARTGSTSAEPRAVRKAPRLRAAGLVFIKPKQNIRQLFEMILIPKLRNWFISDWAKDYYTHLVLTACLRSTLLQPVAGYLLIFISSAVSESSLIPRDVKNCEPGTTASVNDKCFNQKLISWWILGTGLPSSIRRRQFILRNVQFVFANTFKWLKCLLIRLFHQRVVVRSSTLSG